MVQHITVPQHSPHHHDCRTNDPMSKTWSEAIWRLLRGTLWLYLVHLCGECCHLLLVFDDLVDHLCNGSSYQPDLVGYWTSGAGRVTFQFRSYFTSLSDFFPFCVQNICNYLIIYRVIEGRAWRADTFTNTRPALTSIAFTTRRTAPDPDRNVSQGHTDGSRTLNPTDRSMSSKFELNDDIEMVKYVEIQDDDERAHHSA